LGGSGIEAMAISPGGDEGRRIAAEIAEQCLDPESERLKAAFSSRSPVASAKPHYRHQRDELDFLYPVSH
jgi:hypothetical protein